MAVPLRFLALIPVLAGAAYDIASARPAFSPEAFDRVGSFGPWYDSAGNFAVGSYAVYVLIAALPLTLALVVARRLPLLAIALFGCASLIALVFQMDDRVVGAFWTVFVMSVYGVAFCVYCWRKTPV